MAKNWNAFTLDQWDAFTLAEWNSFTLTDNYEPLEYLLERQVAYTPAQVSSFFDPVVRKLAKQSAHKQSFHL